MIILIDEIHIQEDLVHNKTTGNVIGFTNLSEVNNHLLPLEQQLENDQEQALAKTMLVVKGLFNHYVFHMLCFLVTNSVVI